MNAELIGDVLKSVSRSFYLTIRALPRPLREPVGLAYLLARASDTIADSPDAPVEVRLKNLVAFGAMIETGANESELQSLRSEIVPSNVSERRLIESAGECLDALRACAEADRADIVEVLRIIVRGQELDLRRFADSEKVSALPDAAALEEYTYLVAGCVGEFWTQICFRHLRSYARLDAATMRALGRGFGQGLQLVNILRDLRADLQNGRCYLPADELAAQGVNAGNIFAKASAARAVVEKWIDRAEKNLAEARRYIESVRSWRLRFACILPWAIGVRTLAMLRAHPPLETDERIKVSRAEVRALMFRAARAAFSNRQLDALARAISAEKSSAASR